MTNQDKKDDKTKEEIPNTFVEGDLEDDGQRCRLKFPLYCVSANNTELVAVGGGGGASKTGIANKAVLYRVKDSKFTEELSIIDTKTESIKCLAFHPQNDYLVCGTENKTHIIPLSDQKTLLVSEEKIHQTDEIEQKTFSFSSDGKSLCTGGDDGILRVWNFPSMTNKKEMSQDGKKEVIDFVEFDPTNEYIAVTSQGRINIWKLKEKELIKSIAINNEMFGKRKVIFRGCRFSIDGKSLYTGKIAPGGRSWIVKWQFDPKNVSKELKNVKSIVAHRNYHHNALTISPNGEYLATGTDSGSIAVFKTLNLSKIMEVQKAHSFFITGVHFTSDSKSVLSVSADYSTLCTEVKQQESGNFKQIIIILTILLLLLAIGYGFLFIQ